jgi:hypothetical protein
MTIFTLSGIMLIHRDVEPCKFLISLADSSISEISTVIPILNLVHTVALIERASRKKSICLQTLKVGANDRSAQELQNGL